MVFQKKSLISLNLTSFPFTIYVILSKLSMF